MKYLCFVLLITLLLVSNIKAKNIEVPKIDTGREYDLKLGDTEYYAIPNFKFKYIYERGAQLVNNGTSTEF